MSKAAVTAAKKAGKIIASNASSVVLRDSVWQDMAALRNSGVVAKSGRWLLVPKSKNK